MNRQDRQEGQVAKIVEIKMLRSLGAAAYPLLAQIIHHRDTETRRRVWN